MGRESGLVLALALVFPVIAASQEPPRLVVPYQVGNGTQSEIFSVGVNGQSVAVTTYGRMHVAHFAFAGLVTIEVRAAGVAGYTLSPQSAGLRPEVTGDTLTLKLTEPRKLLFWKPGELASSEGSDTESDKLFLFADPPEDDVPAPSAANVVMASGASIQSAVDAAAKKSGGVVYVPPGRFGGATLRDNVAVYLAPGAEITSQLDGRNTDGVKLFGRGAITADGYGFYVDGAKNVIAKDVVFVESSPEANYTQDATFYNIKAMRENRRDQTIDGNGASNLLLDNVFFWSSDDATAIGYRHSQDGVVIRNSVLGTWMTGACFKIVGSKRPDQAEPMYEYIRNYTYENNDCLIGEGRFISIEQDCGGDIYSFFIKNIRMEHTVGEDNVVYIGYATWDTERTVFGYGQIHDITFSDIDAKPGNKVVLDGHRDAGTLQGIVFDNFYLKGSLLTADGPVQIGDNVDPVAYKTHDPVFVSVVATGLYGVEGGAAGELTVRRTGPTQEALAVPLIVRGTATPGEDYGPLPTLVTFPVGKSEVTLRVAGTADGAPEGLETVFVSLANMPLQTAWTLGNPFHAMVNLVDEGTLVPEDLTGSGAGTEEPEPPLPGGTEPGTGGAGAVPDGTGGGSGGLNAPAQSDEETGRARRFVSSCAAGNGSFVVMAVLLGLFLCRGYAGRRT